MIDAAHLKGFGRLKSLLLAHHVNEKLARRFSYFVEKLQKTRGPKGALLYLDELGNKFLELVSGETFSNPKTVWVRKKHIHNFRRVGNVLLLKKMTKIKRHIFVTKPTPEQVSKFLDAVNRPHAEVGPTHTASLYIRKGVESLRKFFPDKQVWSTKNVYLPYLKRELKRGTPLEAACKKAFKRLLHDTAHAKELGIFDYHNFGSYAYNAYAPLNRDEVDQLSSLELGCSSEKTDFVGTIYGSQEAGLKLRIFGAPDLTYQCELEPLKTWSMGTLREIPEDACHDAQGAVDTIETWLGGSSPCEFVDVSNATDTWLLALLVCFMEAAGLPRQFIWLFSKVSKGRWHVDKSLQPYFGCEYVQWRVGQPLGTGPSFGLFSLCNHALIRGICLLLGKPFDYFVVGDDVAFKDVEVAREYRSILTALGIKISEAKSITSSKMGEFAGYLILPNKNSIRPGKWREVTGESLMNFVLDPSLDYKQVVPKYWIPLVERMKNTFYPYGLKVPNLEEMTMEGLGDFTIDCLSRFTLEMESKALKAEKVPGDPGLISDSDLLQLFFHHVDLPTTLYGVKDEVYETPNLFQRIFQGKTSGRSRRAGNHSLLAARLRQIHNHVESRSWYASSGNVSVLPSGYSLDRPLQTEEGSHQRRHRDDAELGCFNRVPNSGRSAVDVLSAMYHLPDGARRLGDPVPNMLVVQAVRDLYWLVPNVIMSFSQGSVVREWIGTGSIVRYWIDSVPFLSEMYENTLRDPSPVELVRDIIASFPFYTVGDFTLSGVKFTKLLRRFARGKDVMPSTRVAMPFYKGVRNKP